MYHFVTNPSTCTCSLIAHNARNTQKLVCYNCDTCIFEIHTKQLPYFTYLPHSNLQSGDFPIVQTLPGKEWRNKQQTILTCVHCFLCKYLSYSCKSLIRKHTTKWTATQFKATNHIPFQLFHSFNKPLQAKINNINTMHSLLD